MNYENAKDLLPEELLKEVQKYAGGKLLYIPVESESKGWGEVSGYRQKLLKRNIMIYNRYKNGTTLSELADEYCLSLDSIKKIVYGKKEKQLLFSPFISSAVSYANEGLAEEWIKMYYELFDKSHSSEPEEFIVTGVLKIPLRLIEFEAIQDGDALVSTDEAAEPLIVHYREKHFYVHSQKELLANLKKRKVNAYPAFIIIQKKEEYRTFMSNFGRHFMGAT